MSVSYRSRRVVAVLVVVIVIIISVVRSMPTNQTIAPPAPLENQTHGVSENALLALNRLLIKGRAPKTDYSRDQFGNGWALMNGCDMRNIILNRDFQTASVDENCKVVSGTLLDPYGGMIIQFVRGEDTSDDVQIDHVVALSDAWQKGAQQLTRETRIQLANDPLELLAVDGKLNQTKSDSDAASWLPPNKAFRCQYVARQIAVKQKYALWVTQAEYDTMKQVLDTCPAQLLPKP